MENRKIIHIDMDAFYASIEQRDHPEYRGKPLVVGRPEKRGVVAAASYEARRYGIRSAMSSMKAKQLCPDLIFVGSHMEYYKSVSMQIHEIFHEYTDMIEPLALDEAFLDVTENKKNIPLAVDVAREIKNEIKEKLGLVAPPGSLTINSSPRLHLITRNPTGFTPYTQTGPPLLSPNSRSRHSGVSAKSRLVKCIH